MPPHDYVLWAVKIDGPDWDEQIITTNPDKAEQAKQWALANGFRGLREAFYDQNPPDFLNTIIED